MLESYTTPRSGQEQVALPSAARLRFDALEGMLTASCDQEHYDDCLAALTALRDIFSDVRCFILDDTLKTGHIWRW